MKINERGYWENPTAEGHAHDEGLAKALVNFFRKEDAKTILDVGCGDGYYLLILDDAGFDVRGVDGNPHTPSFTKNLGLVGDLTKQIYLGKYDWVLCLEVGEHIPEEYENTFLGNLHSHNTKGIILSWAIRGQGGDGHINCLDNIDVIAKLDKYGYLYSADETAKLRGKCAEYPKDGWWFRNTLMVFHKVTT